MKTYNSWLENIDEEDRKELLSFSEDKIKENFSKSLSFGTGGIRAKMGLGPSKMNKYIVRKVSQGISNYLTTFVANSREKGVLIAYDVRNNSKLFAENAAKVFLVNGIKACMYDGVRTTPELSFAVRRYNFSLGIVITASHNSKEYNGYKVYMSDGCQIVSPEVDHIIREIDLIDDFSKIKYDENLNIEILSKKVDEDYLAEIKKLQINEIKNPEKLNIIYTPLHGTALKPVTKLFSYMGYNYKLVESQAVQDGNFPTIFYPNPESKDSFDKALELVDENTDIIINNDPDCDRVGVAVVINKQVHYLNGNDIGIIVLDYILKYKKDLPKYPNVVTTIVSTPQIDNVKGIKLFKTLTGFKYIGQRIGLIKEGKISGDFLFGFEESFGFLYSDTTRDKDGVLGAFMVAEIAAFYKSKGLNLVQVKDMIDEKYGKVYNDNINISLEKTDKDIVKETMDKLRNMEDFFGEKILEKIDYLKDVTGLPKSNVLKLLLKDNTHLIIRPSGTEPKLKIYLYSASKEKLSDVKEKLTKML